MKRTIWIGILLLCIGIGKVRAQNDPVLAGMILLYTDKAEAQFLGIILAGNIYDTNA